MQPLVGAKGAGWWPIDFRLSDLARWTGQDEFLDREGY